MERRRGYSRWIRFGELSLRCLLAGVEACCRDVGLPRWSKGWKERGSFLGWNAGRMGLEGSYFLQGGHGRSKEFLSSFPRRRRKPWGLVHLG